MIFPLENGQTFRGLLCLGAYASNRYARSSL